MSNNTPAPPQPPSEIPDQPSDLLVDLIVTFLAPMFLFDPSGNIAHARLAALETLNAYRIETQADLIAVAQIVAFGLAALASLSQSMEDGVSVSQALRLRGNANACHRSAEQNRRALGAHRPASPQAETRQPAAAAAPPSAPASNARPTPAHPSPAIRAPITSPTPNEQDEDAAITAVLLALRGTGPLPPAAGRFPPPLDGCPAGT